MEKEYVHAWDPYLSSTYEHFDNPFTSSPCIKLC